MFLFCKKKIIGFFSDSSLIAKKNIFSYKKIALLVSIALLGLLLFSCGKKTLPEEKVVDFTMQVPESVSGGLTVINSRPLQEDTGDFFSRIKVASSLDSVQWQVPKSWEEVDRQGVRFASFQTSEELPVTLVSFPGNVGGVDANIQRWLGQINQERSAREVSDFLDSLKIETSKPVEGDPLPYILVDFQVWIPSSQMTMLVAIFSFSDQTAFIKMSGLQSEISKEKSNFFDFVSSFSRG